MLELLLSNADKLDEIKAQAELINSIRNLVLVSVVPLIVVGITVIANARIGRDARRAEWNIATVREQRQVNLDCLTSTTQLWLVSSRLLKTRREQLGGIQEALKAEGESVFSSVGGGSGTVRVTVPAPPLPAALESQNSEATDSFRAAMSLARVMGNASIAMAMKEADAVRAEFIDALHRFDLDEAAGALEKMLTPLYIAIFDEHHSHSLYVASSTLGFWSRTLHRRALTKRYEESRASLVSSEELQPQ